MKQFDLQEYLKNPDRQIVTRKGVDAKIICTDGSNKRYPILALIQNEEGKDVLSYTNDGLNVYGYESPFDLFFITEKKDGWINVCRGCGEYNTYVCNRIFATKEEAKREKRDIIATIKIEWEEDNGED